eukprot:jgi/Mesen1/10731/ME000090S10192
MEHRNGSTEFNYLQRVKVYRLNDEGKWDDKGTGHVSVEYLERSDAVGLVVIDEEDNATLLVHRISADDIYQRQEDTIVSWTDPEVATDLALSFQETMGCAYIWDQICNVQRQIHFPQVAALQDPGARHMGDELEHSDDALVEGGGPNDTDLPPVELGSLPQVAKVIVEATAMQRDHIASMILRDQNYIRKLLELFKVCEDLENLEGLHLLYRIVRGLILLNDGHIFDILFGDSWIMDVIGALEYDPDAPCKQDHRNYLRKTVVYKEAVPIRDPVIVSKIHQTYKIGYIKDVILPRALDDQTFGTLSSLMLFNNVEVVSGLQNDRPFIMELFSRLRTRSPAEPQWRDLVFFLQEFCNLHKHLQPAQRNQSFSSLIGAGLFEIVTTTLQHSEEAVRLSGTEILMSTLSPDPGALRAFLVEQPGHMLFSLLIRGLLVLGNGGLQVQLLEMMRMLLDSDTMEATEKSKFLDVFYEKYIDQLVGALAVGCSTKGAEQATGGKVLMGLVGPLKASSITAETLGNICELLCFCVQHHSFRIKYYVLRNNVVEKVLRLTRRREKHLVVAAVRFLRTCVGLKDEFYYRYLVKNSLFEPVIAAFLANGNRYNLLNSAVIELVDFVRKEGIKSLITHLVETYGPKLAGIDYVDTFQLLQLKYDQAMEGVAQAEAQGQASGSPGTAVARAGGNAAAAAAAAGGREAGAGAARAPPHRISLLNSAANSRKRKDERALDRDEENYFGEHSDDEEDTASAPLPPSPPHRLGAKPVVINGALSPNTSFNVEPVGLVDYDDEDDDPAVPSTGPVPKQQQQQQQQHSSDATGGESSKHEGKVPDTDMVAINTNTGERATAIGAERDDEQDSMAAKRRRVEVEERHQQAEQPDLAQPVATGAQEASPAGTISVSRPPLGNVTGGGAAACANRGSESTQQSAEGGACRVTAADAAGYSHHGGVNEGSAKKDRDHGSRRHHGDDDADTTAAAAAAAEDHAAPSLHREERPGRDTGGAHEGTSPPVVNPGSYGGRETGHHSQHMASAAGGREEEDRRAEIVEAGGAGPTGHSYASPNKQQPKKIACDATNTQDFHLGPSSVGDDKLGSIAGDVAKANSHPPELFPVR